MADLICNLLYLNLTFECDLVCCEVQLFNLAFESSVREVAQVDFINFVTLNVEHTQIWEQIYEGYFLQEVVAQVQLDELGQAQLDL